MNTTNASNGWRWLGVAILLLILLVLWLMGLGPSLSGSQAGCCGVAVAEQPVVPPVSVAQLPVDVAFKVHDGKVILSGEMPTEAERHNAFNAATAVFGAGHVIDQLTVWKSSSLPGWWQNIGKVLTWVKSGADFGINHQGDKITLTGTVASDADKLGKEAEIKASLGGGRNVENQMSVEQAAVAPPMPAPVANTTPEVPPCSNNIAVAISFNSGSAALSADGKKQLDQVAQCLTTPTEVAGHTDNVGDDTFNNKLSKARANAVITYITVANPAKGALLSAVGYGETKPVADNGTAEGRAKNRRIEFTAK
jgi:OOP family OmpA-OmpF porin